MTPRPASPMGSTPALPPDTSLTFTSLDKKTKAQWECVATNIANHVPQGARYALPSDVVVTFLKRAMEGTTPETWHVALQDLEKGHVKVVLTVAILGVLDADFLFKIVSLVVERIDSLEAKVRDLEEGLGAESTDVDMAEEGGGQ
ncbi:hypothetical protein H257_12803 [Aphanomyces astaci]|uniref:Uncharacterized protein n=1 Tax=Aphanomyces astaci TaxID=112090 RepID=W4FWX6_APHAT|nr:hypothetical protein H257_12803 [Aphanomyces astaci]ETV71992.1 hypothetical protein H257_12803 [Aphanomyces astaci]|eukprot:XP_009838435.1 hypothetical protein H257_12803 [Aphanomyces astaci]